RGRDDQMTGAINPEELRPGDVIVVPSSYGGCDLWGWNPRSEASVPDIGDEAYQASHRCAVLRLSPALLREALLSEGPSELAARAAAREFASLVDSLGEERDAEVVSKIESYKGLPPQWQSRLSQLGNRPLVLRDAEDRPLALMQRRRD